MFGRAVQVMKVAGIPIRLDPSWLLILALVTWSLATGWFPLQHPDMSTGQYWLVGTVGALGLFVSIVLHELAHALTARRLGVEMRGITLFLFGGVAEMASEPKDSRTEMLVALAGPLASVLIAGACWVVARAGGDVLPLVASATVGYLASINMILVAFNMIPAFPLDGGRVFRAMLWRWKGNVRWATRISSQVGAGTGAAFVVLGFLMFMGGNFVGGAWMALIGLFLRGAARSSYQQLQLTEMLGGEPVLPFAQQDVVTVRPDLTIRELVEEQVYRHHFKMFPVTDNGRLLGMVTTQDIRSVPRERWDAVRVRDVFHRLEPENTVPPDGDALEALSKMRRNGQSRLLVVSGGSELVGVLSLKDLLDFFNLKLELEEA